MAWLSPPIGGKAGAGQLEIADLGLGRRECLVLSFELGEGAVFGFECLVLSWAGRLGIADLGLGIGRY